MNSFNPIAAENVMCRNIVSISWDGFIYDCDFNQMLNLQIKNGAPLFLWDVSPELLEGWSIQTGDHCLACSAGCGSSCFGELSPVET